MGHWLQSAVTVGQYACRSICSPQALQHAEIAPSHYSGNKLIRYSLLLTGGSQIRVAGGRWGLIS
jgi:hypothetical protein